MYGLLGEKLGHSYSKMIHEMLGYDYRLIEKRADELPAFLSAKKFDGLNVTIPYKKTVMDYCDEVSDLAGRIGAVNTLYFAQRDNSGQSLHGRSSKDADKMLFGTNTDYEGLRYALDRAGISLKDKKVLILGGSGGAGSMVQVLAKDLGAMDIVIASRSDGGETVDYRHLPEDAEIVINATPVGTYPDIEKSPIDLSGFKRCTGVCDLIYNPLRTTLLMQAKNLGIRYTNGLPMLVRQAAAAAEYFHGNLADAGCPGISDHSSVHEKDAGEYLPRTEEIIARLEKQTENIVLIGMPGCGKSSIGKILAKKTGRPLRDTDEEVKKMFGRTPAQIIRSEGEASFREKETKAVASLAKEHSIVIATGGGAVKDPRNADLLKQNGRIFFIDRDPEKLSTYNRPLSQNGGVYRIYDERYPNYSSCCDHQIKNNGEDFSVCAGKILSYYK